MAAHKRRVLRVESQIAVLQKEAQQYRLIIEVERNKLSASVAELKRFELAWCVHLLFHFLEETWFSTLMSIFPRRMLSSTVI